METSNKPANVVQPQCPAAWQVGEVGAGAAGSSPRRCQDSSLIRQIGCGTLGLARRLGDAGCTVTLAGLYPTFG